MEEGLLDLGEFGGIHDLEDVLDLVEEHNLFRAVGLGPVPQQAQDDLVQSVGGFEFLGRELRLTSSVREASFSRN